MLRVFKIAGSHLQFGEIQIGCGAFRRHIHGSVRLMESIGGVAEGGVGVGEKELRFDVGRIGFEYQLRTVLGLILLPSNELQPSEFQLCRPVIRLELDGSLKFDECAGPALKFELRLRELKVCLRVAGIELDGAAVVNEGLGIFSLVVARVALREEFLRITVASVADKQSEQEKCCCSLEREWRFAEQTAWQISAQIHMGQRCNFAPPYPLRQG